MADNTEDLTLRILGDNSSLNKALVDSQGKVKALGADLASGGSNVKETFTEATKSLAELQVELSKAENLTDEQAKQVSELASEYAGLAVEAGKSHGAIDEGAARNVMSMRGLEAALEKTGNSGAIFAGKILAVGESFAFGWKQGKELNRFLDELSDGGFSRLITTLEQTDAWQEAWLNHVHGSINVAQEFNNELNILRKNGIDPTGMSVEEVRKKVDELGRHLQGLGTAFDDSQTKIKEQNQALEDYVSAVEKGGEVSTENADKIVADAEKQIHAINELPANERKAFADRVKAYQGFIDQYTAATTKFQEQTEKEADAAEKGADREIAARKKVTEEAAKEAAKQQEIKQKALEKALSDAQKAEDKIGSAPGGSDAKQKQIQKDREELAKLNDIQAQNGTLTADQQVEYDRLKDALFVVGETIDSVTNSQDDWNTSLGKTQAQVSAEMSALSEINNAQIDLEQAQIKTNEAQSEAAVAAALATTKYSEQQIRIETLDDGTRKLSNTYDEQGILIKRNVDGFTELSNAQGDVQKSEQELAEIQKKYGESAEEAAKKTDSLVGSATAAAEIGKEGVKVWSDQAAAIHECNAAAKDYYATLLLIAAQAGAGGTGA